MGHEVTTNNMITLKNVVLNSISCTHIVLINNDTGGEVIKITEQCDQ